MRMRVVAVILAAIAIAVQLMYLLIGGGGDLFAQRTTITSYMPDATGLSSESEVRLSGIRIGTVQSVAMSGKLDLQRPIRVDLRILKRYLKSIPVDSHTSISSDTLVGWAFVDITEGKSPATVPELGVIESEPYQDAAARANMIKVLTDTLTQVDQMLIEISSAETKVGQFIVGSSAYDNALAKISGFDKAMAQFLSADSPANQILFSPKLYDQIHKTVTETDKALAAIQNGEGTAGHLFTSDEQYDSLVRQMKGLRTSLADANASTMLHDDASYRRIVKAIAATDAAIESLNHGGGRASELLSNPQLYESLNGSVRGLGEMLKNLQQNPRKYLRIKY